jgi:hypothetical protein
MSQSNSAFCRKHFTSFGFRLGDLPRSLHPQYPGRFDTIRLGIVSVMASETVVYWIMVQQHTGGKKTKSI